MPLYIARILAPLAALTTAVQARERAAVPWIGLAAGYLTVFVGFAAGLLVLADPDTAVTTARVLIVVVALACTTVMAFAFGRLFATRRTVTGAVEQ